MRFLVGFFVVLCSLLAGCASAPPDEMLASAPACERVEEHLTTSGEQIPEGFLCETSNPRVTNPANACTYIQGYQRKDGAFVQAHYRCKHSELRQQRSISSSPSIGGSVSVRGYYRKDGTYVRPHTRSGRR